MIALSVVAWSFACGWLSHRIFFAPLLRSLEKRLSDEAAQSGKGGGQ
jgi:hypothetical protein